MGALKFDWQTLPQIIAGFIILAFVQILIWVSKILIEAYKEKNKKADEGFKELQEKIERRLDQFQSFLTSYIEDTIRLSDKMMRLSDKMEGTEKRLDDLMKLDFKLRRMNSAIKIIAGDDWPRIKKELTDDEVA